MEHGSGSGEPNQFDIAIIGMSGRFPGAKSIDEFWHNLCSGTESVTRLSDKELVEAGVEPSVLNNPGYVKAASSLDGPGLFDASFFGYTPGEAELMDPQHRLFLECAWEALENAGYDATRYDGLIGVYGGASMNTYFLHSGLASNSETDDLTTLLSSDKDFLTTRVSYRMDLKGPSFTIGTGCSTSLVAVHLACQSLLNQECDIAMAGGVTVRVPHKAGYLYRPGEITSPDGHCRAFDSQAQGTIFGSGLGIVVLKRLENAIADGDNIYAAVKGSAINNDGHAKVGYTAPSVDGQARVILEALANAGVGADTISYVEAHGTGTNLGDPVEVAALAKAYAEYTSETGFCAIGSVKTNIGHLDVAAGITGFIKTTMMLQNKAIPPILHFKEANPEIDFENSPFYVNTRLTEWESPDHPRRAGVSSFGVGGTNAHAILEEAPATGGSGESRPWQILPLSAKTGSALEAATRNLASHLKDNPDLNLADVAYTLQNGRREFDHRRMVVCQDMNDAITSLETLEPERVFTSFQQPVNRGIVFMFSPHGSQYINMGRDLYDTEPVFREEVDRCCEIIRPQLGLDLRDIIYPNGGNVKQIEEQLESNQIAHTALFTVEYALARLWMSWGVYPSAMTGHSLGEYVAACLSGIFSLEDALSLLAINGKVIDGLPSGSVLAVSLSEQEVQPLLERGLCLACVNGPYYCTVAGENEAVDNLERELSRKGVEHQRMRSTHAFHSEMLDPVLDDLTENIKRVKLNAPQIPLISNATGKWIKDDEAKNPEYWARLLRDMARFSDCVQELLKEPERVFLEVGPGHTLSTLVRHHPDARDRVMLSTLRHPQEKRSDIAFILNTIGRLWLAGVSVDWSGFYKGENRRRLPLPTYPFERQRYWIEPRLPADSADDGKKGFQKKPDIAEWFYVPSWKRSLTPGLNNRALADQKLCWLVFADECGLGSALVDRLATRNQEVLTVQTGERFGKVSAGKYTVNPQEKDSYDALMEELTALGKSPDKIIHLWSVTANESLPSGMERFERLSELGFYSLTFLTQALARQRMTQPIDLEVVTNHLHDIIEDGESLCPEKASILGPCKVIPQEYPNITCRSIDIDINSSPEKQVEYLISEALALPGDPVVAHRGGHRWVQIFEPVNNNKAIEPKLRLREGDVYLITGGLGEMGMVLAEYLAREFRAKLILTGRSEFPAREKWLECLANRSETEVISRKIQRMIALEELGAEVMAVKADAADENRMSEVIAMAESRFGEINGVIHAAGIATEALIPEVKRDLCEQQFRSKVKGVFVLEKVLEGKETGFCILVSSLSSVLGGLGFTAYAAANLFMDAFVQRHNHSHSVPWLSINWDGWQLGNGDGQAKKRETELTELLIKPGEGKEAFRQILSSDMGDQIVVSTGDLHSRLDKWIRLESLREPEPAKAAKVETLYSRPSLSSSYIAPGNATEESIAEVWQQALRIEKVGIHDNFVELGGHSLLATQVIARLKSIFPVELSVESIFENPTVHSLSKMILEQGNEPSSFDDSKRRGLKRKERNAQRRIMN